MQHEPTPEHRWLQQLVGEWMYEGSCGMGPDQPPMTGKGRQVVELNGSDQRILRSECQLGDGSWIPLMTAVYHRVK